MGSTRREFLGNATKGAVSIGVGLGLGGGSLASLLAACGFGSQPTTSSGPIKIGFAIGQSGLLKPYDGPLSVMAELAIADSNQKGGMIGHQMTTVYANTNSEIPKAATAGLEVIDKGARLIAASDDFDFGGGTAVVANSKGLICFSLGACSLKFGAQGIGPYAFTTCNGANTHGAIHAEWAYKKQGWRSVYILQDTSISYQKELTAYFIKRWSELAGAASIIGNDTFALSDPSIATQITRYKSVRPQPDFLFLVGYPPGNASAARQLRAAGVTTPLFAPVSNDGAYWLDAAPNLSDFYNLANASIYGDDPKPEINALVQRYKAKTGADLTSSEALQGYAMIQMWVKAAEMANSIEPKAMLDALNRFKDVPTILGNTTFTPEQHFTGGRGMAIVSVQQGKRKWVDYYTPEKVPTPNF